MNGHDAENTGHAVPKYAAQRGRLLLQGKDREIALSEAKIEMINFELTRVSQLIQSAG